MPDKVTLLDSEGRPYDVDPDKVEAYKAQGFTSEPEDTRTQRIEGDVRHDIYGGIGGALQSGAVGVASGLTLGLSDVGISALGGGHTLQALQAEHPYASFGGNVVGAILPTILTGGAAAPEEAAGLAARIAARTPAGLTAGLGRSITEHAAARLGSGVLARAGAATLGAAGEGALYGGGQYLSEAALEDKPLSVEGFVGGMGHGALFAAPIGGGLSLGGEALIRARSLFPSRQISEAAARSVQQEATSGLTQAMADGEAMADTARKQLELVDAKVGMAQSGEQVTRRVFGGADPQALADQATGGIDRAATSEALQRYEASKAQLHDWIAGETNADLEGALSGLHPDLMGASTSPINDLEGALSKLPEVGVQRDAVPVGEFSAPGKGGFKSQEELARLAADTGEPPTARGVESPASADATRALRGGAKGTPVGEPPLVDIGVSKQAPPTHIELDPDPHKIWPWNEAFDNGRVSRIADSMREHGWIGDPLVVVDSGNGKYRALTGSHRLAAAEEVGIKVPAVKLELPEGWKSTSEGLFRNRDLINSAGDAEDFLREDGVSPHIIDLLREVPERPAQFAASKSVELPTYEALKAHAAKYDDYLEQMVPASAIAERGYYETAGGHADAVKTANARKAIADGQREAVRLNVSPKGKITVSDGRHRLAAAIEAGAPVKVKWSHGLEPAGSDVLRSGRSLASEHPPISSLSLDQLRQEARLLTDQVYGDLDSPPSLTEGTPGHAAAAARRDQVVNRIREIEDSQPVVAPPNHLAPARAQEITGTGKKTPSFDDDEPPHDYVHDFRTSRWFNNPSDYTQRFRPLNGPDFKAMKEVGSLTDDEVHALYKHTTDYAYAVNKELNSGALSREHATHVSRLDAAIAKSKAPRDLRVFRGIKESEPFGKRLTEMRPGEILDNPALTSTSASPESARDIGATHNGDDGGGSIVMVIDVPKDYPAAAIKGESDNEREVLLKRGTRMRLVSNEVSANGINDFGDRIAPERVMHFVVEPESHGFEPVARPAGGTQGGGWFRDPSGEHWFGKSYGGSVDRVEVEHLANRIYRMFGVSAPETELAEIGGRRTMMSKEIKGEPAKSPKELLATDANNGFIVDAWLANWDVLGEDLDNMLVSGGKAHRIDNGGSTIYRAQGATKDFAAPVREVETMRSRGNSAGRVFSSLTKENLDRQLVDFARKYDERAPAIDRMVDQSGMSTDAKRQIKDGLRERAQWLQAEAAKVEAAPVAQPVVATSDSLTGLLRGTKERLAAGDALKDIGAPARAEYAASKAGKTSAAAEHFRGQAVAKNYAGSAMAAGEAAAAPAAGDLEALLRGTKQGLDSGASMGDVGAAGRALREGSEGASRPDAALKEQALEHFSVGKRTGWDIERGIPATEGKYETFYVVKPSELAERQIYGDHVFEHKEIGATEAWNSGKKARPITIDIDPAGRLRVSDGNHRLLMAARNGDAPVLAEFWHRPHIQDVASGREDIGARLHDAMGGERAPAAPQRPPEITATDDMISAALRRHGIEPAAPPAPAAPAPGIGRKVLGHVEDPIATRLAGNRRINMMTPGDARGAVEGVLAKRVGKNVDMGPGLARAAKVIGDYEAASAGLVDAVGPHAPPSAVANAKSYHAATAGQADAMAASSARSAQDIADKIPPADSMSAAERAKIYGDKTEVDSDITKALRAHDAKAAAKAARARPAATKPAASEVSQVGAPAATSGLLGKATTAGAALEVLKALGVHVPVLSAIPVIGPILGAFLKAKAVMGILGRKGGSIGASVEGSIAAKAAATRNRIGMATGALLESGGRGAQKAASFAAGPSALLAGKLFPGGKDTKSKEPQVLYHARMDEIARAQQPGAIDHAIADRYQTSDPELHDALVAQVARGVAFLDSKAPKQTVLPGMLPGDGTWHPSKAALDVWGRYVHAVNNPASVLEDLVNGHVTMEGAETLRVVYPRLFAEAQQTLLEAAPKMRATLPYARRQLISILFQVPIDGSQTPEHVQYLKTAGAPAPHPSAPQGPPPGAPAITGPLRLGQQTMTPLDHRAGA